MAPGDREERRLNRQRGAGTRQIQGGNFNFTFSAGGDATPITLPPTRPATRQTPKATSANVAGRASSQLSSTKKSLTRTPGSVIRVGAILRSAAKSSVTQSRNAPSATEQATTITDTAEGSAVSAGSDERHGQRQPSPLFVTPAAGRKRRRTSTRSGANVLADIPSGDELERDDDQHRPRGSRTPASSNGDQRAGGQAIQQVVDEDAPDILLDADKSQPSSAQSSANSQSATTASNTKVRKARQPTQTPSAKLQSLRRSRRVTASNIATPDQSLIDRQIFDEIHSEESSVDELSPETNAVSRSMVTSTPREAYQSQAAASSAARMIRVSELQPDSSEIVPSSSRSNVRQPTGRNTKTKISRQKKKAKRATTDENMKIPITVYRPVVPENLIIDDPLGEDPYPSSNAVDALAQTASEIITEHIDKYALKARNHATNATAKSSFKRGRKALIAFQKVLQDQLFNISTVANTATVYESRLRRLRKEVVGLRQELIGVREERHAIEAEKDDLRVGHARMMEQNRRRRELNDDITDIAQAIQRGRGKARRENRADEGPEDDPSADYHAVLDCVDAGGILGRIKNCNSLLEQKMAEVRS